MKKSNLILSLLSLVVLTGCGKTIAKEDAKKYAEENFSREKVAEKYTKFSATTTTNVKKADGFFATFFTPGKKSDTKADQDIKDAPMFDAAFIGLLPDSVKITTLFGNITVNYALSVKDIIGTDDKDVKGSASAEVKISNIGLITSSSSSVKYTINKEVVGGVKVTGSLEMVESISYSYSK
jgi:lipoprotein